MKRTILENTDRYSLVSYGNGTAYALNQKPSNAGQHDGMIVFVQGDDAWQFAKERGKIERKFPNASLNANLDRLWSLYSDAAEDWATDNA
jgi:hypothetical protein